MSSASKRRWVPVVSSTVVAVALVVWMSLLTTTVYVLGGYLLAGWLFSPLVTRALRAEHDTPISFVVRIYPRALREVTAFGWFVALTLLTIAWTMMMVHAVRG